MQTTWKQADTGIEKPTIWSLAIDPQQPQTLFAGVWGEGLWRSTDGAQSWTQVSAALTNTIELTGTHVIAVAVDPTDSQHIYAGVMDDLDTDQGRFVQSWDGGESWEQIASRSTRVHRLLRDGSQKQQPDASI